MVTPTASLMRCASAFSLLCLLVPRIVQAGLCSDFTGECDQPGKPVRSVDFAWCDVCDREFCCESASRELSPSDASSDASSAGPTSDGPTTDGPTTDGPTTDGPTVGPTSDGPTTAAPTTAAPTTAAPTTAAPTTVAPTTEAATTAGGDTEGTTVKTQTTSFNATLVLTDLSKLSLDSLKTSMTSSLSGASGATVTIKAVVSTIKTSVAFDAAATEANVKTAMAKANEVPESDVTVAKASRRLQSRRLSTATWDVEMKTEDLDKAKALMTSAADVAKLTEALKEVNSDLAAPTIEKAPSASVVVVTEIVTQGDTPIDAPTPTALKDKLKEAGVEATVELTKAVVTVTETKVTTKAPVTTKEAVDGAARPAAFAALAVGIMHLLRAGTA